MYLVTDAWKFETKKTTRIIIFDRILIGLCNNTSISNSTIRPVRLMTRQRQHDSVHYARLFTQELGNAIFQLSSS